MEAENWTMLELGVEAMSEEDAWFAVCVLRSTIVQQTGASTSAVMKAIWPLFFGHAGHDFAKSGIIIELSDRDPPTRHVVFADFSFFVGDDRALKFILGCKGCSRLNFCYFFLNAVRADQPKGEYTVPITETDTRLFIRSTDHTVRALLNDLKNADDADREELETLWGWAYNPLGIMGDLNRLSLKPVSQTMLCWMHTFLVDGTWNLEVFFLLVVLKRFINIGDFVAFMSKAELPKHDRNSAKGPCSEKEVGKMFDSGDHFKCSASEGLALYPLIMIFLQVFVVPKGVCRAQVASYMAMVHLMDLLSVCRFGLVSPAQVAAAAQRHMELFVQAYETFGVKPNFHFEMDFAELLARFGTFQGSENNR